MFFYSKINVFIIYKINRFVFALERVADLTARYGKMERENGGWDKGSLAD